MSEIRLNSQEIKEEKVPEIMLHFFRHDEKAKGSDDTEVRLTEKGKLHAKSLSSSETDLSQAMAFGSPRKRTQETAGLVMAGAQDGIEGTESLEDLKTKINSGREFGSKLMGDSRLDFIIPESGPYFDELMTAYKSGKLLKYYVEESDRKLVELGVDKKLDTYSSLASKIAELIAKYLKILPRWEELVKDEEKNYEPVLERFTATHQSVGESFLAKVIEVTKGVAERDAFVAALNNQGFDFAEGFNTEIVKDGEEEKVHITFKKEKDGQAIFEYDEVLPREVIEGIIVKSEK